MVSLPREVSSPSDFGPIRAGTITTLHAPYTALVGTNNSGKSALLQTIFKRGFEEFGADAVSLIVPDRFYLPPNLQPGNRTLTQFNQELFDAMAGSPLPYHE